MQKEILVYRRLSRPAARGRGRWFFLTVGERGNPSSEIGADAAVIGRQKTLNVTFSDSGRGLRRTEIVITQDNQPRVLSAIDYPENGGPAQGGFGYHRRRRAEAP